MVSGAAATTAPSVARGATGLVASGAHAVIATMAPTSVMLDWNFFTLPPRALRGDPAGGPAPTGRRDTPPVTSPPISFSRAYASASTLPPGVGRLTYGRRANGSVGSGALPSRKNCTD